MNQASEKKEIAYRVALSIGVTLALLLLLYYAVDVRALAQALRRLGLLGFGILSSVSVLTVALRWARLQLALGMRPSRQILRVASLHGAAVAVLPAKLGELILPLALKRYHDIELPSAIGLLLILRFYDLLLLVGIGAVVFFLLPTTAETYPGYATLALFAACLSIATAALLPWLARIGRYLLVPALDAGGRVDRLIASITHGIARIDAPRSLAVTATSGLIWCSIIALSYAAVIEINGPSSDPLHAAAAGLAGSLAFVLPISGIANAGPFEAAFAGTLTALGMGLEPALASAVAVHLAAIVGNVVSVILAYAIFPLASRNAKAP